MSEHRRPGRPQIADPEKIGLEAAALFAERGYAGVSMDDVAARSGVSRRTLFRHFANKADLVWHDFFVAYGRLEDLLAHEATGPGMAGLRSALRQVLTERPSGSDLDRVRFRIIGESDEVFAAGVRGLGVMTAGLAHQLSRDGMLDENGVEARAAGQAVTGCILAASVWWAQHSDDELVDVIDAALARLEQGIA
ncbi:TetR family transcriptional regulator [Demequina mangrovi]|uniref:Transcriptional regulator, TetR family n=1 Tax=Demequina mangrovi TaxID=1043493 RepID=A0A1H6UQ76_9MICO|nr:TetR family transcriptional regulator [Demequina mangrovi]SEI94398.1 transcriptional regulator, TetR family [Demequina mangrovi]